ncbi:5'(3')-deoxyribonucleotidase, mitochondrial-like [Mya arenaria]|uniref:5'(3')-deoxyribonucleotidase, mitochondrial-like n=1 Tax=Mya arenaria TaxID=6604 RepID=UPI0022E21E7D|nr:5'(3')-deoxyribonucleotidase, mitochondrial-like [Mya arenaria]XP_052817976.1 5'(3')-deoxyribonucleotidase, mitochondrial-like [Mya arenaria]XP_052817983.1 5'(3')-deoxyribonucleotidase, mitochondrial-like [Mya arenaria]XP_052817990.1 5'(3')-deoxyribonucleotidase, mitochondrial-like [Mya arenaria]XP_052817999.1 5'(3')-deoxyribonucleotidase, mitochondrial-like [Mya arenaria]
MAHRGAHFQRDYSKRQVNLRALIDMDGVLCDFEAYFLEKFKEKYPDEPFIAVEDRDGFYIRDQYEKLKPGLNDKCSSIWNAKAFFLNIPVIPGAVEAAKEMQEIEGVDVFICTSPVKAYKHCLKEKYQWVEKHMGKQWLDRILLVKDKTMVNGHLLIDDRPGISGLNPYPSWDHILFTQSHNSRMKNGQRRLENWTDGSWKDLIDEYKKRVA